MLHSAIELTKFDLDAADGEIGRVKDFYFDDDTWTVRYVVVDAGSWLHSRQVLISPISLRPPRWPYRSLPASITRNQVKDSPTIETDEPVSRQNEEKFMAHYGYPYYWGGPGIWGEGLFPYSMFPGSAGYMDNLKDRARDIEARLSRERARTHADNPHLRSCKELTGYHIHAVDGEIGHVVDFLVDDETWTIQYFIVDTGHWWLGHKVLIAPSWNSSIDWTDKLISVDLTRDLVKRAPAYEPIADWDTDYDRNLHGHYGFSSYWDAGERLGAISY